MGGGANTTLYNYDHNSSRYTLLSPGGLAVPPNYFNKPYPGIEVLGYTSDSVGPIEPDIEGIKFYFQTIESEADPNPNSFEIYVRNDLFDGNVHIFRGHLLLGLKGTDTTQELPITLGVRAVYRP